jgi:putative transposase
VEAVLHSAAEDLLAFTSFSAAHGKDLNDEPARAAQQKWVRYRTDAVDLFANPDALRRMAGTVLVEAHDERQSTDRRYFGETTMAVLAADHRREGSHIGTDDGMI